jgi:acetyl-CoA hydrolase
MGRTVELDGLDLTALVRPGETVAWGQATAEPRSLTERLMAQRHAIGGFRAFVGISYGDSVRPEHADRVRFSSYCGTGRNRLLARAGQLEIVRCDYSRLPELLAGTVDVLLLQLAPAGTDGRYSLGLACEYLAPLVRSARLRIGEVNDQVPWTHGGPTLGDAELDWIVRTSRPPLEVRHPAPTPTERAVARRVAALVEDGATVQLGLGALPEAVAEELGDRRDLGVHSGAMGDGLAALIRRGVVTNARKGVDPGVSVAGLLLGSRTLFELAHRNPAIQLRETAYTHGPDVLPCIERLVAINGAIEVDLTGQVNAEIARGLYVGAVGGAGDFLRGAARSRGGLPIVALPSTAGEGEGMVSRIIPRLSGPVSTPSGDVGLVVTEHGVADLRGVSLAERARRLIAIAHPRFREWLEEAALSTGSSSSSVR